MYHNLFKYKSPIDTHTSDTPKIFLLQRRLQLTSLHTYHHKFVVELPGSTPNFSLINSTQLFYLRKTAHLYLQGLILIDISHITKSEVCLCLNLV